jgi:DNA-binding response OmpR family regulator
VLGPTYARSVVVVDPDHDSRRRLVDGLGRRGFGVTGAATGLAGVEQALREACDALVVALPLPDLTAQQFVAMMRAVGDLPVLALLTDGGSVVPMLDAGADDAVCGRPDPVEVDARIRAVLRRSGGVEEAGTLRVGDLTVDPGSREARLGGRVIDLSRKEFDLLHALARRRGRVASKRELMAEVWKQPYGGGDKTVDVHLSWLRHKLGESGSDQNYLRTVRGVGVRLVDPAT